MYRDCRKGAGMSILTASLELEVCKERLIKIEYGEEEPHPELVHKMCNLYKEGLRLANWHCANKCSIGRFCNRSYAEMMPALAGMQLLGAIEDVGMAKHNLVKVLRDGRISQDEIPIVETILEACQALNKAAMALEIEKEKTACVGAQTVSSKN